MTMMIIVMSRLHAVAVAVAVAVAFAFAFAVAVAVAVLTGSFGSASPGAPVTLGQLSG